MRFGGSTKNHHDAIKDASETTKLKNTAMDTAGNAAISGCHKFLLPGSPIAKNMNKNTAKIVGQRGGSATLIPSVKDDNKLISSALAVSFFNTKDRRRRVSFDYFARAHASSLAPLSCSRTCFSIRSARTHTSRSFVPLTHTHSFPTRSSALSAHRLRFSRLSVVPVFLRLIRLSPVSSISLSPFSALKKAVGVNEGAKKPDGSTEKLKLRAKNKAKERVVQKYYENTNKTKENDACAERKVAAENARNDAKVNVVSTRTTTDTKVFRSATKSNKANTVAMKSELVKPISIKIDDEEKLEAIEGNKMGVVSARLVTVIIMRS